MAQKKLRLFIASSSENLDVAYSVQENLDNEIEVTVWTQGVFSPSKYPLESLLNSLQQSDFGVFVFNPDDDIEIRGEQVKVVRDNILFELGLFVGKLGRERNYILVPKDMKNLNFRIATDLIGITPIEYDSKRDDHNLLAGLGPACHKIRREINKQREIGLEISNSNQKLNNLHEFPLTIVVGDRREKPPETPGDFFASTSSSRDLTWLCALGLPKSAIIWNDKISLATDNDAQMPDYLKARHLLIVGSPYCNLLARKTNKSAIFNFNIAGDITDQIAVEERKIRGLARYEDDLQDIYSKLSKHDEWVMQLRGMGFNDPIKRQANVGTYCGHNHDYAVVSVCEHPYSTVHFAVLVGGLHLPGTMAALKCLADPDFFKDRPFGGVLKVTIPEGEWYERLTRSKCTWFTPKYTINDLSNSVDKNKHESLINSYRKYSLQDLLAQMTCKV